MCSLLLGCHCSQDLLGGNTLIQTYAHICNYFCMYPSVSIGKYELMVMSPTLIQYHMIYSSLFFLFIITLSLVAQMVKHLPAMRETRVWFLSGEDPLEKEMATHSNTLACKIPWTEEPGRLYSPWCCKESDTTEGLHMVMVIPSPTVTNIAPTISHSFT